MRFSASWPHHPGVWLLSLWEMLDPRAGWGISDHIHTLSVVGRITKALFSFLYSFYRDLEAKKNMLPPECATLACQLCRTKDSRLFPADSEGALYPLPHTFLNSYKNFDMGPDPGAIAGDKL